MRFARLSIVTLALVAQPVCAQSSGSRTATGMEAADTMRAFTRCVVRRAPEKVDALLGMDFRSDAYRQAMRELVQSRDGCMRPGAFRAGGLLVAGGLAEASIERRLDGRLLAAAIGAAPDVAARDGNEESALCTVRAEPAGVQSLLATTPASSEEREAVMRLSPTIAGCVPQGVLAQVNARGLRPMLALAAYRMIVQGADSAAGN